MIAASRPLRSLALSWGRPSHVVGVYFDDDELTAVECRHRRRDSEPAIVRAGRLRLAPGVVDHGEIVDGHAFADALRHLWDEHRFETNDVVIGSDGRTTVIRQAELPVLASDELAQAAAYQIDELLSFPLAEAVVSTLELDRLETEEGVEVVRTITVAAHQDGLLTLHDAIRAAGLRLVSTELVASALVTAAVENDGDTDRGADAGTGADAGGRGDLDIGAGDLDLIVHVTTTATLVAVGNRRGLAFSRVITAGVEVGATSLSDELEMELAMLGGSTETPGDLAEAGADRPTAGIATVVEGVRRTVQYYRDEIDRRPIGRLLLCGPQSDVGGLASALAASIPDARILRLRLPGFDPAIGDPSTYDAAASVAIVTTNGGRGHRGFDLTPAVVRERRAARHRIAIGVVAAALLTPILAADALDRRGAIADERAQAEATELAVEGLREELATLGPSLQLEAEAERATAQLTELRRLDLGFQSVVQQVAESMPDDTFLISLHLGRANPGELPTGFTGEPPPATLTITGVAGDLDGVGRWLQTVDEVPVVDGLWLTQSAVGPYGATDRIATVFTVDGAVTGSVEPPSVLDELGGPPATDGSEG